MSDNDNDRMKQFPLSVSLDSHGRAALLLVESLIHGLCESKTLSISEAMAIVERAAEVQQEQAEAAEGAGAPMWHAHSLLAHIGTSLQSDVDSPSHKPD